MKNAVHKIRKINIYLILILLIIFGIFQYGINKICGFTLVPDEFGYWSSAARTVGYDWSPVASLGSYYSPGYSFLLIPILKLFSNGVAAYRAAVFLNMLLMCAGVVLMQEILKRMFPEIDKAKRALISGTAVLYPSWIFYMQMTMTEALLMFLFVFITWVFICLIQKTKVTIAAALAVALIYIYCVHMRTVGVLIACVITLFLWMLSERPNLKTVITFWGVLLLFLLLAAAMKQNTIAEVFANADARILSVNDYGSQWGKLRQIFTTHGIVQFAREVMAKVFYLGLASFGIFYWGIVFTIKKTVSLVKKLFRKERGNGVEWTALFLLLSITGEILIGSIYMFQGGLIDTLIYGRYDEFVVPVFILLGIAEMSRSRWLFKGTLLMGTGTGLFIPVILNLIEKRNLTGIRGYMVAGISYLLKEDELNSYLFFRDTWILCFGVMLLCALFVWLSGKNKNAAWILSGILVIEIAAGLQISNHYTYTANDSNFMDLSIAETIEDKSRPGNSVLYLDEGKPEYIDFIQMQLREKTIEVIGEEQLALMEGEAENLFLITHKDTFYRNKLENVFDNCLAANTFYLFYNDCMED